MDNTTTDNINSKEIEEALRLVEKNGWELRNVKVQTPEICLTAMQHLSPEGQEGHNMYQEYLNILNISYDMEEARNVDLDKFEMSPLPYVKEQTEEICMAAVKHNGLAIKEVNEQTEKLCTAALDQNGLAIAYIRNPTQEMTSKAERYRKENEAVLPRQVLEKLDIGIQVAKENISYEETLAAQMERLESQTELLKKQNTKMYAFLEENGLLEKYNSLYKEEYRETTNIRKKQEAKDDLQPESERYDGDGRKFAPDFTKGYPLPAGWQWQIDEYQGGCLVAPNSTSTRIFFEYDSLLDEIDVLGNVRPKHEVTKAEIEKELWETILPEYKLTKAMWEAKSFPAYLTINQNVEIPVDCRRVYISEDKSIDARIFRKVNDDMNYGWEFMGGKEKLGNICQRIMECLEDGRIPSFKNDGEYISLDETKLEEAPPERYGGDGEEYALEFAKGYDLPEGWKWIVYKDNSGRLIAPNSRSFFEYDLAAWKMRDAEGTWQPEMMFAERLKKTLYETILPEYELTEAMWKTNDFPAYLTINQNAEIPEGCRRVYISEDKAIDTEKFRNVWEQMDFTAEGKVKAGEVCQKIKELIEEGSFEFILEFMGEETKTSVRELYGGDGEEYAPKFTKGYDLPEGWKWVVYEDRSGYLKAPNYRSFFNYDLTVGEMKDVEGKWSEVMNTEKIEETLNETIMPEYELTTRLQEANYFPAYLTINQKVDIPQNCTRILVCEEKPVHIDDFRSVHAKMQQAADQQFRDTRVSTGEVCQKLSECLKEGRSEFMFEGTRIPVDVPDLKESKKKEKTR